jgi:hypothetical protein
VKKIEAGLDPEQGCSCLLYRLAHRVQDELSLRGGVGGLDWRRGADLLDLADRRKDLQQNKDRSRSIQALRPDPGITSRKQRLLTTHAGNAPLGTPEL